MESPNDRFGYLGGRGIPELREALAAYLNRVRGTATSADRIVITAGFSQGIRLAADALMASGRRRFGLEDPGHAETREMIEAAGGEVVPIPVDESGMQVRALPRAGIDVVVVTAAHQYPTGAVLPPQRRAELVAWANATGGLIVEDDYDAEFRYDREPIGAIQGLAPDRVIYAGSASKVFAPGLRLGWLAAPAGHRRCRSRFGSTLRTRARPRSTSSPSRTSSPAVSSTATCGGCARSTGAAATRCSRRLRAISRSCDRSGPRPGCTCWRGCRRSSTRPPSSPPPAPMESRSKVWPRGCIRRPGPHGLDLRLRIDQRDRDGPGRAAAGGRRGAVATVATLRRMSEPEREPAIDHYPNGNVRFLGANLDGKMHGPWEFFRADGSLMRSGSFVRGRQVGTWTTYDRSGRVVKETRFPDDGG